MQSQIAQNYCSSYQQQPQYEMNQNVTQPRRLDKDSLTNMVQQRIEASKKVLQAAQNLKRGHQYDLNHRVNQSHHYPVQDNSYQKYQTREMQSYERQSQYNPDNRSLRQKSVGNPAQISQHLLEVRHQSISEMGSHQRQKSALDRYNVSRPSAMSSYNIASQSQEDLLKHGNERDKQILTQENENKKQKIGLIKEDIINLQNELRARDGRREEPRFTKNYQELRQTTPHLQHLQQQILQERSYKGHENIDRFSSQKEKYYPQQFQNVSSLKHKAQHYDQIMQNTRSMENKFRNCDELENKWRHRVDDLWSKTHHQPELEKERDFKNFRQSMNNQNNSNYPFGDRTNQYCQ